MSCLYVTTQGAYVRRVAGQIVVTRKDEQLAALPLSMVEAVVLFGHVQVSTQAVQTLLEEDVPLVYLSRGGSYRGILRGGYPKNTAVRLAQYEASMDSGFALEVAKALVDAKIRASLDTLARWDRNHWAETAATRSDIRKIQSKLSDKTSLGEVRAVEGQAAQSYFKALGEALPPGFEWRGRNRQPPRDPVNALLSMAYMLVLGRAIVACHAAALDPHVGFLHQLEYGRPSLALDLLEPLRAPCCDQFVLRHLQAEEWEPSDFTWHDSEGCRMTDDALHRFLVRFQSWVDPENPENAASRLEPLARELRGAIRMRETGGLTALYTGGGG